MCNNYKPCYSFKYRLANGESAKELMENFCPACHAYNKKDDWSKYKIKCLKCLDEGHYYVEDDWADGCPGRSKPMKLCCDKCNPPTIIENPLVTKMAQAIKMIKTYKQKEKGLLILEEVKKELSSA